MRRAAQCTAPILVILCLGLIGTPVHAGNAENGKTIYSSRCGFCHGMGGKGDGPAGAALNPPPPDFTTAGFWSTKSSDAIKAVIAGGKPGTAMMGFNASLSAEQLDDLVAYLQTFKPAP